LESEQVDYDDDDNSGALPQLSVYFKKDYDLGEKFCTTFSLNFIYS